MEINNNNLCQFQGSFLIKYKNTIPELKVGLEEVIGKNHKQIFENINGKKDNVMYVLKNSKDVKVANYITQHKMKFKFYPEVNTQCRFDEQERELVIEYIKKNKPICHTNTEEMLAALANRGVRIRKKLEGVNAPAIDNILSTLKFNKKDGEANLIKNEIVSFVDNYTKEKIFISPSTKLGTRFVYSVPSKEYETIKRYAFDEQGNILKTFDGPNGIKIFNEQFQKTIKNHNKPKQ